jgi:hypothetical protein
MRDSSAASSSVWIESTSSRGVNSGGGPAGTGGIGGGTTLVRGVARACALAAETGGSGGGSTRGSSARGLFKPSHTPRATSTAP